uniref:Uncharacterized protein n=1 Tax=Rhizophora mucronata TaxID=61149 RepID=A0A2P2JJN9_RHIMU
MRLSDQRLLIFYLPQQQVDEKVSFEWNFHCQSFCIYIAMNPPLPWIPLNCS